MATESDIRELMRDYTPLAIRIAARFKRRLPGYIRLEDLRAAAMGGLWDAIRLRPDADYFEKYARVRISGAIRDDLREKDWLPRLHRSRFPDGVSAVVHMSETVEKSLAYEEDVESRLDAARSLKKIAAAVELLPPRQKTVHGEGGVRARDEVDSGRLRHHAGQGLPDLRGSPGHHQGSLGLAVSQRPKTI